MFNSLSILLQELSKKQEKLCLYLFFGFFLLSLLLLNTQCTNEFTHHSFILTTMKPTPYSSE